MRFAMLALLLFACGGSAEVAQEDCAAAVCQPVTFYPEGRVEDGAGLPHIGCRVSIVGCEARFAELCHAERVMASRCPVQLP